MNVRHKRDTRLIVAAVGISALGDFLLWIPLTLHIQEMTDSGIAVAGLMLCLWGRVSGSRRPIVTPTSTITRPSGAARPAAC